MELEYAKSLCSPALLPDLSMSQIAEVYDALKAGSATAELSVLYAYTDKWFDADPDARDLEALHRIYAGDTGKLTALDKAAKSLIDKSEQNGFLAYFNHTTPTNPVVDTYVNSASLQTLAQEIALHKYIEAHDPASLKTTEFDVLKDKTVQKLNQNLLLDSYSELDAAEYLVNEAGLPGLTVTPDALNVQASVLDAESGLPDLKNTSTVELVNKNAMALNRNFNNITVPELLSADKDLNTIWSNVVIPEDKTPGGLPKKSHQEYMESLIQAALTDVYRKNIANGQFAVLPADRQRAFVLDALKTQVITDIVVARAASGFEDEIRNKLGITPPNAAQKVDGSPEQAEYNRLVLQQLKGTLGNETTAAALTRDLVDYLEDATVLPEDKKIKINPYMLLANHADKDVELAAYTTRLNKKLQNFDISNGTKKYRHTAVLVAKRQHGKVEESGRKTFSSKLYAMAVNMRRFVNNNPGKAWEVASNLGIAGGSVAMTLGWVSNPVGWTIGGAMIGHYFAKTYIYPTIDQMKRLQATDENFANLGFFKKWKLARQAAKEADDHLNFGRNAAVAASVTGAAAGLLAGPLGMRAGVAFMTSGANMWRTWREAKHAEAMYRRTGDAKYLEQLKGGFGDKVAKAKGLKKAGWWLWNKVSSKQTQKVIATGGFLGAITGLSVRLSQPETITELASHGHAIDRTGLTANGTHEMAGQQIAAQEYSQSLPKGGQFVYPEEPRDFNMPHDSSLDSLEVRHAVELQHAQEYINALDSDLNTRALKLPAFRDLQSLINNQPGEPIRDIIDETAQQQLQLLAGNDDFKQMLSSLAPIDREAVEAMIKAGNARGLVQFIEDGSFQSPDDYWKAQWAEILAQSKEQAEQGLAGIKAQSVEANAWLETLIKDESFKKMNLTPEQMKELGTYIVEGDKEKLNAFLEAHGAAPRIDAEGNILNVQTRTAVSEILYGDGHRTGDAASMNDYVTRTDAKYTRMLNHQAVHSNYNDHFTVNGEQRMVTAAEYLQDAEGKAAANFLKGKPAGMTVKDYVVHRHMLREYVHVDTDRDLSGELARIGVSREQWTAFLKGESTPEIADKVFTSKLGAHAGRVLIDKEVICGEELNVQQTETVRRALSLNNHDPHSAFSEGRMLYVEAPGVPSFANNHYGLQTHYHYELDCNGNGRWVQHIVNGKPAKVIELDHTPVTKPVPTIEPAPRVVPEPVVNNVPTVKEIIFEPQFTTPRGEVSGYVINRIAGKSGSFDMMEKPDYPAYITFDKAGTDVLVRGNEPIPLERLTKDGKMPEMVKEVVSKRGGGILMDKSLGTEKQTLYLQRYVDGQYISSKISSDQIIIDPSGKVSAQPVTYTPEQLQNVIATTKSTKLAVNQVSELPNGGYAMLTDKGLVRALPDGDKLKVEVVDIKGGPTNLSVEQQKTLFEQMQKQITEGKSVKVVTTEHSAVVSEPTTPKVKPAVVSEPVSEVPAGIATPEQIAALEKAGNVKCGETQIQVNPSNLMERGMRTVTPQGFFNEIRDTNTGQVIRVEGVDINGKPIPAELLRSDKAPDSYKLFHKMMDNMEKRRLGTNFKGGYLEAPAKEIGDTAQAASPRVGQRVSAVIGRGRGGMSA